MLRIGITGAHGLGKTTLAKALAKEFDLYYLPEVAREMLDWSPDKDWRNFSEKQVIHFEKALCEAYKFYMEIALKMGLSFVTDRTMADIKAYTKWHCKRGVINHSQVDIASILHSFTYIREYTHIIFVVSSPGCRTDDVGIEIQNILEDIYSNSSLIEKGFTGRFLTIPAYPNADEIIEWIKETTSKNHLNKLLNSDTDLAAFVDLYKRFGIDVKINKGIDMYDIFLTMSNQLPVLKYREAFPTLSNKFGGHPEFYSRIVFDKDGKFVKQEFWE